MAGLSANNIISTTKTETRTHVSKVFEQRKQADVLDTAYQNGLNRKGAKESTRFLNKAKQVRSGRRMSQPQAQMETKPVKVTPNVNGLWPEMGGLGHRKILYHVYEYNSPPIDKGALPRGGVKRRQSGRTFATKRIDWRLLRLRTSAWLGGQGWFSSQFLDVLEPAVN